MHQILTVCLLVFTALTAVVRATFLAIAPSRVTRCAKSCDHHHHHHHQYDPHFFAFFLYFCFILSKLFSPPLHPHHLRPELRFFDFYIFEEMSSLFRKGFFYIFIFVYLLDGGSMCNGFIYSKHEKQAVSSIYNIIIQLTTAHHYN